MTDKPSVAASGKRILVSLDSSSRGRIALEAAVRLAVTTHAELQGIFVEDEDLVRLASLPFACEIEFASAIPRQLQSASVERALQAAAAQAQHAFARAVQQANVHWTFRTVRGSVTQALLAAAGDVDLLVIGQQGRCPRIMGGEYLPKGTALSQRVVAVFDGSPSAIRTLEFAKNLAEPAPVYILVLADDGQQVMQQCSSWLKDNNVRAEVNLPVHPTIEAIVDYVRRSDPSVLLLNRDSPLLLSDILIDRLVNQFECPLILC